MTGEHIWSRRIADELWSGIVTPLTFTMLADLMAEHMVRRRLDNAGLSRLAASPVFRLSRGHVYVNASLVAEVMREVPTVFASEGLLELLPEGLRQSVRESGRSLLSPTLGTIVLNLGLHERGWMPWTRAEVFRVEASRIAPDLAALAVASDAPSSVLASTINEVRARLGSFLEAVSWGMIHAYVFFHLTAQLIARWAPDQSASIAELTSGLDGIRTFEIHDELLGCAIAVRADAELRAAVMGDPLRVAALCLSGGLGAFGTRIRMLIERHGHRLVGRDLSYATWRERPAVVIEMVQKLLQADPRESAGDRRARHDEVVRRVSAAVAAGLGGSLRLLVFERSFAWCRTYYVLRENMRYHADLFLSALRSLALTAASRMVALGQLREREDVFYLEAGELQDALLDRDERAGVLAERAAMRRGSYAAFRSGNAPESFVGEDLEIAAATESAPSRPAEGLALRGLGVSPGRAVGSARVVHSVEDLRELRAGEVIVATSTDPSWTSLLAVGGAIVLEMGGLLSHGAIVARELGIPAVVNVAQATRLLATGDRIVVDGRAGTVALA